MELAVTSLQVKLCLLSYFRCLCSQMVEFELHFNVMKHFGRQDSGMRDKIKGSFITELMKTVRKMQKTQN